MPDGSVRARRRGFRAAHPAYGRTARPGRPLGARRRGARADTRRASGSRVRRPAPGQAARRIGLSTITERLRSRVPAPGTTQGRHPAQRPGILSHRASARRSTSSSLPRCTGSSAAGAAARGRDETRFPPARRADQGPAEVAVPPPLPPSPARGSAGRPALAPPPLFARLFPGLPAFPPPSPRPRGAAQCWSCFLFATPSQGEGRRIHAAFLSPHPQGGEDDTEAGVRD